MRIKPPQGSRPAPEQSPYQPKPEDALRPIEVPEFTIKIDTREQAPWHFDFIANPHNDKSVRIIAKVTTGTLATGDYSIEGLEHVICIERKSLEDLRNTVIRHRDRFKEEHHRMADIVRTGGLAVVLIEGSISKLAKDPLMASIESTRASWHVRFGIPWMFEESRGQAARTAFRLLDYGWRHINGS